MPKDQMGRLLQRLRERGPALVIARSHGSAPHMQVLLHVALTPPAPPGIERMVLLLQA